jgi:citrate lyase beta subunit
LFAPGDDARKLAKAAASTADSVILELEDGVAPERKPLAREQVVETLRQVDFGARERLVRVNAVDSPWFEADLTMALTARPDGLVLPKVERAGDVAAVDRALAEAERVHGLPERALALLILIETPRGLIRATELCAASSRLQAVIFGAEDYAGAAGAERTPAATEVLYARSHVVAVCGAFDLQPIDMVFIDFNDPAGLEAECRAGRQLGFVGKQVIHPRQLETVNAAFSPTPAQIAWAERVVAGFRAAAGGAYALDGKMIDAPVVRQAERILAARTPS